MVVADPISALFDPGFQWLQGVDGGDGMLGQILDQCAL